MRRVKAAVITFAIVEKLDELKKVWISYVANKLSIAKSTAHKRLQALVKCENVARGGEKYRLGQKHLEYGRHVLSKVEIAQKSGPVIDHLVNNGRSGLDRYRGTRPGYVREKGAENGRCPHEAESVSASTSTSPSVGKVLLANLPPDRIDEVIERKGLPRMTQNTITEHDELMAKHEEIRERRVAFNDCESLKERPAVASPITHENELKGAIAIVGTANRMKGDTSQRKSPTSF